jgi:hypothetical protein
MGVTDGHPSPRIRATPARPEWTLIDLTQPQTFGKVVLFARSDLVDFSGTGFPSSFVI